MSVSDTEVKLTARLVGGPLDGLRLPSDGPNLTIHRDGYIYEIHGANPAKNEFIYHYKPSAPTNP